MAGCQHTLQPVPNDDFQPPCIPALTISGFVRWQCYQLLLAPSLHVPVIQYAVDNWGLKHPRTGEPFPAPLPAMAFPTEPDELTKKWFEDKSENLRRQHALMEAASEPRPRDGPERKPEPVPEPRMKTKSASSSGASRSSPRQTRHAHVSSEDSSDEGEPIRGRRSERSRGAGGVNYVRPAQRRQPEPLFSQPGFEDNRTPRGRQSHSNPASPLGRRPGDNTRYRPPTKKLSQPKMNPIIHSSDTESSSPKPRSRAAVGSDPALHKLPMRSSVRHVQPGYASPRRGYSPNTNLRPPPERHDDRRKSFPFEGVKDKLMNTVSHILSGNPDRPRSTSRTASHGSLSNGNHGTNNTYRSRGDDYVPRHDRFASDTDDSDGGSSDRARRQQRPRAWDKERERSRQMGPPPKKERHDRERERDRDILRERGDSLRERDGQRDRGESLRERDRDRDRDRERERERGLPYEEWPPRPLPRRASPYRHHVEVERKRVPDNWMDVGDAEEPIRQQSTRRRRDGHAPPYRSGRE